MCIICNLGFANIGTAEGFLSAFDRSRGAMKAAADGMLGCADAAQTDADRKRYKRIHKQMVRLMREWNSLEQKREARGPVTEGPTAHHVS